jgi:hypothetical protein
MDGSLPNQAFETRSRPAFAPRLIWLIVANVVLVSGAAALGQTKPTEFDVKAAYLFNFGKFIRVTQDASPARATFDICIVGQDSMGHTLDAVTDKEEIDHRGVHVRRVKDATEARSCDIAYISASEGERVESDVSELRGADVLTVSDAPRFLAHGGMIQFVQVANHVRFAVNLEAVKRTHLVLSSELLRVAVSVSGVPGEALP